MRKNLLILFNIILLVSCNDGKRTYSSPSFPVKRELSCRIVSGPLHLGYPVALSGYGNNLFVLASSPNGWVHVYDRENGVCKGSRIKAGRGPGEVINAIQVDVDETLCELSIYDEASEKLSIYDIDTLQSQTFTFKQAVDFSHYGKPVRQVWKLRDKKYLSFGQVGVPEGKLGRFQLLYDDEIHSYNAFPTTADAEQKAFLSSFYALSPDRSKLANGTLFGAILETFDVSGKEIRLAGQRLIYPPAVEFKSGVVRHKTGIVWGFSSICASDDMIFCVFIDSERPDKFDNVAVFDWEGKEIACYNMDYDILRLFYTEDSPDSLYAIVVSGHEYYLAHIDIPDLLAS